MTISNQMTSNNEIETQPKVMLRLLGNPCLIFPGCSPLPLENTICWQILAYMKSVPDSVVSNEAICKAIWNRASQSELSRLEYHCTELRKKMQQKCEDNGYLQKTEWIASPTKNYKRISPLIETDISEILNHSVWIQDNEQHVDAERFRALYVDTVRRRGHLLEGKETWEWVPKHRSAFDRIFQVKEEPVLQPKMASEKSMHYFEDFDIGYSNLRYCMNTAEQSIWSVCWNFHRCSPGYNFLLDIMERGVNIHVIQLSPFSQKFQPTAESFGIQTSTLITLTSALQLMQAINLREEREKTRSQSGVGQPYGELELKFYDVTPLILAYFIDPPGGNVLSGEPPDENELSAQPLTSSKMFLVPYFPGEVSSRSPILRVSWREYPEVCANYFRRALKMRSSAMSIEDLPQGFLELMTLLNIKK